MVDNVRFLSSGVKNNILDLKGNPAKVQQFMLKMIERMNDQDAFVMDATNPAVFTMESAAVLASANMTDHESKMRKLYPAMANTVDELYLHMIDLDHKGIKAECGMCNLTMVFDLDEIVQKSIPENSLGTIKRLTIPMYTKVTVADTTLSLMHPIDIRAMSHGGFNITFDNSVISPIGPLASNILEWRTSVNENNVRLLYITAPFYQLRIVRHNPSLNSISGYSADFTYDDKWFYTRAYVPDNTVVDGWREIHTSLQDLVYNPNVPTVALRVTNGTCNVTVPQVYHNRGTIRDALRIDIYTTKGQVDIDLRNYAPNSYAVDWSPLSTEITDEYSAPLMTLSTYGFFCDGSITGGSNGMTFEEIKDMVTSRSVLTAGLPINEKQLKRLASTYGYNIVKNIDNITDRQFLATRRLPIPSDGYLISPMALSISTLETSFLKLKDEPTVKYTDHRLTILPETLYENKDGIVTVVPNVSREILISQSINNPATFIEAVRNRSFLYSPYYYVFDIKTSEISVRIYDMDRPFVLSRFFVQDNPSISAKLSVANTTVRKSKDNKHFLVEVKVIPGNIVQNLGPKHVNVQISYLTKGGNTRHFVNGRLISPLDSHGKPINGEYVYEFVLDTQYDIDRNDNLVLMPYKTPVGMIHEFDVVTSIKDYDPSNEFTKTDIDHYIEPALFEDYVPTSHYLGISHSKIKIQFGEKLDKLWSRTRSKSAPRNQLKWEKDIPLVYKEDVYERNPDGTIKLYFNPKDNSVDTKLLHRKGEEVYDSSGELVLKYKKGDPKLDEYNNPIYEDTVNELQREIDIFMIDGIHYFANTQQAIDYRVKTIHLLTDWITKDMSIIRNQLIDRSEVFYHPPIGVGSVSVVANNANRLKINSQQSIKIKAYLTEVNYNNGSLRRSLEKQITESVQKSLSQSVISVDSILRDLRENVGEFVISFDIKGFAGDAWHTVSLRNDTVSLTLGKKLVMTSSLEIDIADDIDIEYVLHIEN